MANIYYVERPRQYQPAITRLPSLILLFTLTLVLIALTELACRRLQPRNSAAFAVLDLKRSLDHTPRIRARELAAAHESDFLPVNPSSIVANPNPIIASAAESVYLSLNVPSVNVPSPTSIDVDVLIQTSFGEPTPTSINVANKASINDPISASISDHIQTSIDASVPGPSSAPSLGADLPILDSPSTHTFPLTPGNPVPSVYLPLGPTTASESVDTSPTSITVFPITAGVSDYLPVGGAWSTYLDAEPSVYLPIQPTKPAGFDDAVFGESTPTSFSTPNDSAYLPLGPTATSSTPVNPTYLPESSAYLPLGPTATYSTPDDSAYLPVNPTKTDDPTPSESEFIPLGPLRSLWSSRSYEPYIRPSLYLPVGPTESAKPDDDPVVFGDPVDYLPLGPPATELPTSTYLPLDPVESALTSDSLLAFQPQSEYLPVKPHPKSQLYLPVSEYLPLGSDDEPAPTPDISKPLKPGAPAETAYLPLESSNPQIEVPPVAASMPAVSAFLPIVPLPTAGQSAYLPLSPNVPDRSTYLPLFPAANSGDSVGGPTGVAILPFPPQISDSGMAPAQPKNKDKAQSIGTQTLLPLAVDASDGELINSPAPTGVFEGENYSLGANGVVVIAGKTFDRSSPTTAILDSGKTLAVGSNGIAILGAEDAKTFVLPPAASGVFEGEKYSLGANGALVIGDKTFDRSSPTTAVLGNGKTIEIGPSGIAIFKAGGVKSFPLPSVSSGIFDGEPYSVGANGAIILGGKTLDRSSPTTAVLSNGKTIVVGPSGIAIIGAKDGQLPTKTFAQPSARTGVFEGEAYSIGSNGVVIIGGKTFDRSSPTTAVLRNGKTVEVGPSGIAIVGAKNDRPPPKAFVQSAARTGIFGGEAYSIGSNGAVIIGGKTFDSSSPTTDVLRNGKTVVVSPSGIAVLPANDRSFQTTALPDLVKAYAVTSGVLGGETFAVGTDGKILIGGKTFDRSSPTSAVLDDGKAVIINPSGIALLPAKGSGSGPVINSIAAKEYVLGAFVPVIVAVLFTIPWQILNAAVKEIEPFYQLQRDDGVTTADSLALEYRSSINLIATFTAIRKGHFLVWWSGLISIVAVVLAPLATETVFIGFQGRCTPQTGRQACVPELNVYPVAARVLQGILSFMALLTLALAWCLHRGKTGLRANAQSIAGLAALFQNQQVIEDFRGLNPHYTTSKMINSALRDNRYRIAAFFDEDGASAYGLVKCNHDSALMDPNYRTAFRKGKKYATVNVTATEDQERPKKHRTFSSYFTHKATTVVFAAFIAGLESLVIYYNQTGGDTGFERWMDSQSFGVAFLFTALGVLIKLFWTHLDDGK